MILTEKETLLLKDMKGQEELCIKKYSRYASEAKATELKNLFESLAATEREHLTTVTSIMNGNTPTAGAKQQPSGNSNSSTPVNYSTADKEADALLLSDMLAMEKHVSSVYDTSIFEFSSPELRAALNHIQTEEQQHGEKLYAYMKCNNMYS